MATRRICRPCRTLFSSSDYRLTSLPPSQSPYRASNDTPSHPSQRHRRQYHTLPELEHHIHFEEYGISRQILDPNGLERTSSLMSSAAFKMAWTEYQSMLLHNLNTLTVDDPSAANQDLLTITRRFARDPNKAQLFNYASQAHNNNFFFDGFGVEPRPLDDFVDLRSSLMKDFRGKDALKALMLQSAIGMFSPGYVWLVWVRGPRGFGFQNGCWRVLNTYSAGTPYTILRGPGDAANGRGRQQGVDMNNQPAGMTAGKIGVYGGLSRSEVNRSLGGPTEVFPVLCVSTWPQVYIRDFSVSGKERFLEAWWENVDWARVADKVPRSALDMRAQDLEYDEAIDQ